MQEIINKINQKGIKVRRKRKTLKYINEYGFCRLIDGYGSFYKSIKNNVNTNDIINAFLFDKTISHALSNYIFDFEMKLNNVIMEIIYKHNNYPDDYILDLSTITWDYKNKVPASFSNDIYENVNSCNLLNSYTNPKEIPLKLLSLSWSFHTLVTFVQLQDDEVKCLISKYYGLENFYNEFISVCHTIRKFRNVISHNGMFIATKLSYYRKEFNQCIKFLTKQDINIDEDITVQKLITILSLFLKIDIEKEIMKKLKRAKVKTKTLKQLKNYVGLY